MRISVTIPDGSRLAVALSGYNKHTRSGVVQLALDKLIFGVPSAMMQDATDLPARSPVTEEKPAVAKGPTRGNRSLLESCGGDYE